MKIPIEIQIIGRTVKIEFDENFVSRFSEVLYQVIKQIEGDK